MIPEFASIKNIIKQTARDELLPRFTQVNHHHKTDGSIVTEADLAVQNRLAIELLQIYPGSVLLSEEMSEPEQQNSLDSGAPIWCLDPLDGTSNYAMNIPYFALSLALIQDTKVIMAVVYDPIRDECFSASDTQRALLNDNAIHCNQLITEINQAIAIIDFKRLETDLAMRLVQQQSFASQRNFGASALDWCWLATNRGHLYLHGKQNIWDYSAGQFIFQKAGGLSSTLDNLPIFVKQLEGRSVIAAVNETLFQEWSRWLNNN